MNTTKIFIKFLWLGLVIAAAIFSGKFFYFAKLAPLLFVVIGAAGLMFIGFPFSAIGRAWQHAINSQASDPEYEKSRCFWEAQIRNSVLLGILGAVMNYVVALSSLSMAGGIGALFTGVSESFLYLFFGLVLAVIFAIPTVKVSQKIKEPPLTVRTSVASSQAAQSIQGFVLLLGYILAFVPLFWMVTRHKHTLIAFIHQPALLVVVGGTIAIIIFMGNLGNGQKISLGFALTGLLGGLMGLIQMFYAMGAVNIKPLADALAFSLTSCIFALLGILLIGGPLQDRASQKGENRQNKFLNRLVWYIVPIATLFFIFVSIMVVLTPIKK